MKTNRRDWLKATLLGGAALTLSPFESMAKQTPNYKSMSRNSDSIRLCFNENPFGVSPLALQAMQSNLSLASIYDFKFGNVLAEKLASYNQLKPENILIAAGSSYLLEMIIKYVAVEKANFITPNPSFTLFSEIGTYLGMQEVSVPLTATKRIDLQQMRKLVTKDTKLVYICNPNNPTGDLIARKEMESFISSIPSRVLILVDEAYIEFTSEKSLSDLVTSYPNLIITRTFSKLFGFAGARLGYAMGNKTVIDKLKKLETWTGSGISSVTMAGGIAALQDEEFIQKVLDNNIKAKNYLYAEFDKRGIKYIPSQANFVYFSLENYKGDYFEKIKSAKILGSKLSEKEGKWTRISIGTLEQMNYFIQSVF